MKKTLYLVQKFVNNIMDRPLPAVASLLSLILLFLMFDLLWISSLSLNDHFDRLLQEVDMEVFVNDGLPDSLFSIVIKAISETEGAKSYSIISKEEARQKLNTLMGADLLDGLEENPLPRSILINFSHPFKTSDYLNEVAETLKNAPGIAEIYYPKNWLEKTESTRSLALKSVIFLGTAIFLAVVLNLLYMIRLSVKVREEELIQLRLLGAGRTFLSIPYILEGVFYALAASAAGWLIIYYGHGYVSFENFDVVLPLQLDIARFCLATSGIGMVGGYIGVRRSI
jgi:cell division transport system permease protein